MDVSFIKISPTQNVTILVDSPIPRDQQPQIAAQLLAYDGVGGEQVGFLEPPTLSGARMRLQMMGGEFCGNATMSLGALLAQRDDMADGERREFPLEISGANDLVNCFIERCGNLYRGTVRMPLPESLRSIVLPTDAGEMTFPLIALPGISHVIVSAAIGLKAEEIESRIRGWNETIRADALGVLLYDESAHTLAPIVYVPSTDSAVWERGCGSGTAALGCWLAAEKECSICQTIRQPGGEITVHAEFAGGSITGLTITGTVKITAAGTAFL